MKIITFTDRLKTEDTNDLIHTVFNHTKTVPSDWELFWLCQVGDSQFYVIAEYKPTRQELKAQMTKDGYDPEIISVVLEMTSFRN